MAMRGAPLIPSMITRTLVCVDEIKDHDFKGTLFNPYMEAPISFESIYGMIFVMDNLFNKYSFPHAYYEYRTFTPAAKADMRNRRDIEAHRYMSDEVFNAEHGKKATFIIQVQFRQNATWQGTITWMDKKKTQRFRSVLEMIKLMDGAISEADDAPA